MMAWLRRKFGICQKEDEVHNGIRDKVHDNRGAAMESSAQARRDQEASQRVENDSIKAAEEAVALIRRLRK